MSENTDWSSKKTIWDREALGFKICNIKIKIL